MLRTFYARVEVEGEKFIGAHLTRDAQELGLTLALPESFAMARPAGARYAGAILRVPIVGKRAWEEAAASA
jgi:hypothetical protein